MKVTVKTLKGEKIEVEVEPQATILDLKNQVMGMKGFDVESQKIVFKGKHALNQNKVGDMVAKEGDFFVLMVTQKKGEEGKKEEKKEEKNVEGGVEKGEEKKGEKVAVAVASNSNEDKISQIINMGFDRETAIAALAAAYNNVDRAVEYCLTGIPNITGGVNGVQGDFGFQEDDGEMEVEESEEVFTNQLNSILNTPAFLSLREAAVNDPSAIPTLINQLATTNPQIYALISQHPQAFMQFLNEDPNMQEQEEGEEGDIPITSQQNEAIERLAALGFAKIEAAQAYLACDKNEQMAANLLFQRQANGDFENNEGNNNEDDDNDNLFS